MRRKIFIICSVLAAASASLWSGVAHAQSTACTNYYTSTTPIPTGYGAAYDIFSAQKELLVNVDCSGTSPHLAVGSGLQSQYVYDKGYLYNNGWQSITLTGANLVSSAWYPGSASGDLTGANIGAWTYVVGYVCTWSGSAWQCGCADTACATPAWQLQAFISSAVANSGGGGGLSSATWDSTVNPNAIVVAPNGNDGNPCTASSPCQSLGRAQQAVRSSSTKIVYLRAGMYNVGSTLALDGNDTGETWQSYPADGVNSAVLDGGGSVDLIDLQGASNLTINGIKMQHVNDDAINGGGTAHDITIENCDIGFNNHTGLAGGFNPIIGVGGATNMKILHNYVHDTASQGIAVYAYDPGSTIDGAVIDGNVVLRAVQVMNDGGAIYSDMRNTNVNGGHITISNNFVRDYGNSGVQAEGIYLDDDTSNATVVGNVIAPPNPNVPDTWGDVISNAGCCNTIENNIIDLGSRPQQLAFATGWEGTGGSLWFQWTGPNVLKNNIIISNFSGNAQTNGGVIFYQDPSAGQYIGFQGNMYHNYGGGAELTNGQVMNDSSPVHADPQISGWDYHLSSNSPAFSQIGFQQIKGGWGPPGFTIPTDGTPPSSPH